MSGIFHLMFSNNGCWWETETMQREIPDRKRLMCYDPHLDIITCYGLSRDEVILDLKRTGHTTLPSCVFEVLSFGLFNYFFFHFQLIFNTVLWTQYHELYEGKTKCVGVEIF